jgi:hypothetical protein
MAEGSFWRKLKRKGKKIGKKLGPIIVEGAKDLLVKKLG